MFGEKIRSLIPVIVDVLTIILIVAYEDVLPLILRFVELLR